uniref:Uncharacterized protein n=1 Tax=Paramoeba aestuarina TaxID=180227 RepID=A0A7S4URJ2_9EUKA
MIEIGEGEWGRMRENESVKQCVGLSSQGMTWSGLWRLRQRNILMIALNLLYGVSIPSCVKLQLGLSLCKRPDGRGVFDFDHEVGVEKKVAAVGKETGEEQVTTWLKNICPTVGKMDVEERKSLCISSGQELYEISQGCDPLEDWIALLPGADLVDVFALRSALINNFGMYSDKM